MTGVDIAIFLPSLAGGGAERVMLTLAEEFVARGYSVDLVVASNRGELHGDVSTGIRVIDLRAARMGRSLPMLARYLQRERPAAMLSALSPTNCVAIWARMLVRTDTRLVVSEHGPVSCEAAASLTMRGRFKPTFMRYSYPHADAVIAVSQGLASDLARTIGLARQGIQVIYNPVITPRMLARSYEPVTHPWFRPSEPPVVLGVGRLSAEKDFSTLIRAFALLRQRRVARLVILGDGEERCDLAALAIRLGIDEDVELPGFVSNPYKYMRAAAAFALSSRFEGLGNVLIEALACGTPVVATDCLSGPAEILEDGKWGRLVPVGRPEALASAINATLEQLPAEVNAPLQRFSASIVADAYLAALRVNRLRGERANHKK